MSVSNGLKVVDLFAGCGLFSHAFNLEGYEVVAAYELDPVAADTYARNIGAHIRVGDLREINPQGEGDVLIAGPPCQGFSTLGKRDPSDRRNQLSQIVVSWAKKLRPQAVVIENVSSFLGSAIAASVQSQLADAGYIVQSEVLDAFEFGVPQRRRRSFVVATRMGGCSLRPAELGGVCRTVREAWAGLPRRTNGRNNHYAPEPSKIALQRMEVIPEGGDKRDVMKNAPKLTPPSWWRIGCQVTDSWGRLSWEAPSNTLRTCLQNASKGRYIHPEENRVISLREAARLHTIEDSWQFDGYPTHIARQIGNSVPVNLGRGVARSLACLLTA